MTMKSKFKLAVIPLTVLGLLAGCTSQVLQSQINSDIDNAPVGHVNQRVPADGIKGTAQDIQTRTEKLKNVALVRTAKSPWIGGSMVPVTKEDGLPAVFNEPYELDFGESRVSLATVASRLTKLTGVPVRVRSDVYGIPLSGTGSNTDTQSQGQRTAGSNTSPNASSTNSGPLPAVGMQSSSAIPSSAVSSTDYSSISAVSMRWNGKLRDFLDHLTNTLNVSWEYRDGTVVILRMLTETHQIAGMIGTTSFTTNIGNATSGTAGASAGSGSGGSTSSMTASSSVSEKGMLDTFTSMILTIKGIVGNVPGTSVIPNAQTGTVTVTASKEVQAQVRDYLAEQNAILRRNVNVTFDIYTVTENEGDNQGVNWNVAFQAMVGQYGLNFSSPTSILATGVSALTLTGLGGEGNGSTAIFNALRLTGKSVEHKPVSFITQNGKLKVQNNTASQGYVKSTTPGTASSSGAAGAPGLNTDTVTTGDIFEALPIVQPDNSVLLKYAFRMSNLVGITNFTSGTGSAQQTVNLPQTTDVGDGTDVRLMPGEAIMITGLSRVVASSKRNGLFEGAGVGLGGGVNNSLQKEHFIVVLRATPL